MEELTELEKSKIFAAVLQRVLAIDFPKEEDDPQIIFLLFHEEELVKGAVYFLQDFVGIGFSLIIEKIDADSIVLKIYEIDTDDFHTCNKILVKTNIIDEYKKRHKKNAFLSVGLLTRTIDDIKIDRVDFLKIPVKSISFQQKVQ